MSITRRHQGVTLWHLGSGNGMGGHGTPVSRCACASSLCSSYAPKSPSSGQLRKRFGANNFERERSATSAWVTAVGISVQSTYDGLCCVYGDIAGYLLPRYIVRLTLKKKVIWYTGSATTVHFLSLNARINECVFCFPFLILRAFGLIL